MAGPLTNAPASNTAAVITIAAPADGTRQLVLDAIHWSYSGGTPTAPRLSVTSGGVTIYDVDPTSQGIGFVPFASGKQGTGGLRGTPGANLVITLAAGGSGVTGKVNVINYWQE